MAADCEGSEPGTVAPIAVEEEGRCGSGTPECLGGADGSQFHPRAPTLCVRP